MTEPDAAHPERADPAASRRGLVVGIVPGVTLTKWRKIWGERYRAPLDVVDVAQTDAVAALVAGRLDLTFARLPLDDDRLHVIPLYVETAVVITRKDHPAAAYDELSLADLADEIVIEPDHPDAIDLVAGGAGVLIVPLSIARSHSRRDLIHRPLTDADPTQMGLAWLRSNDNPLIEDFIGVVRGRTVNSSRSRVTAPAPPPKKQASTANPKARRPRRR